jgi:hypothetical protein
MRKKGAKEEKNRGKREKIRAQKACPILAP